MRTQSCVHLFNTLTEHSLVYAGHCSRHFLTLLCEWCFSWLLWAVAPPPLTVLMSVPFHQPSLSPLSAWPTPEPPCWGPPPQPLPLKPSQPLGLRLFTSGWLIGWKSRTSVVLVYFFLLWLLCLLSLSQLHLQGKRPQMSSADLQTQPMTQETKALLYPSGAQTTPLTHSSVPHPQPPPTSTLAFPISHTSSKETIRYPLR